jgi:hypothetical protein
MEGTGYHKMIGKEMRAGLFVSVVSSGSVTGFLLILNGGLRQIIGSYGNNHYATNDFLYE